MSAGNEPGGSSSTLPASSVRLPPAAPTMALLAAGSSIVTSRRTVPSESCWMVN